MRCQFLGFLVHLSSTFGTMWVGLCSGLNFHGTGDGERLQEGTRVAGTSHAPPPPPRSRIRVRTRTRTHPIHLSHTPTVGCWSRGGFLFLLRLGGAEQILKSWRSLRLHGDLTFDIQEMLMLLLLLLLLLHSYSWCYYYYCCCCCCCCCCSCCCYYYYDYHCSSSPQ